jgi:hypothetical protein
MFERYLLLYQLFFVLVPFITIYPLTFIGSSQELKLAAQWLVNTYMMNDVSFIHIWVLYYLESHFYQEVMKQANKRQQVTCNVLAILTIIMSTCSLGFYERLKWLWMNTHIVSVGYTYVQAMLFWGFHIMYLS